MSLDLLLRQSFVYAPAVVTTSLPWNGYGKDRKIWLEEKDAALLGDKLSKYVEHAIPVKAIDALRQE